ncbi:MAG: glycerophosphoryl diester phosphodiesterase membrane domain-containing protein [Erysipelotrichaceae bacterium]|nr:glycerophosphoryl diester phosphodiesterase membrane domain-containing protein [Erysipelotrichaceae bacterium]
MKEGFKTWRSCVDSFGDIVAYQLVSKAVLAILLMLLKKLAMMALASTGRVAVTTGDFLFLFTTWQGILLLLFGLVSLYLYVAVDINTKIIFANKFLKNEKYTPLSLLKESFAELPRFFNVGGTLIVLFVSLLAPLTGVGLYISLTRNLKIPTFISSVIQSTPLYRVIYYVAITVLIVVALLHIFSIFAIVIDNLKPREAFALSRCMMKTNWQSYLKQSFLFFLSMLVNALFVIAIIALLLFVLYFCARDLVMSHERMFFVFVVLLIIVGASLFNYIGSFCYIVQMSWMYYTYREREDEIPVERSRKHNLFFAVSNLFILGLLVFSSYVIDTYFDQVFVNEISVSVIAHRGGGSEAPENTVEGIRKAILLGVYGSEIDIQRTSDGYYIVNHDGTFSRLCNVNKKPEEMTLAEVKELTISDPLYPDQQEPVATFEEMLEAAKGNVVLFTELKGNTADQQMVDDAVALIRQYEMEDECVLISLKYDIIDYAEMTYPEIQTAYLMFASFGDVASLNCDFLGLEEETATPITVDAIHNQNKKVLVWTPNTTESQRYFLLSAADAIITDNVSQANGLIEELRNRSDITIFLDFVASLFY